MSCSSLESFIARGRNAGAVSLSQIMVGLPEAETNAVYVAGFGAGLAGEQERELLLHPVQEGQIICTCEIRCDGDEIRRRKDGGMGQRGQDAAPAPDRGNPLQEVVSLPNPHDCTGFVKGRISA